MRVSLKPEEKSIMIDFFVDLKIFTPNSITFFDSNQLNLKTFLDGNIEGI